ncbi:hypothetical protein A6B34_04530 [Mycolicibacterium monacense]|uniref:Uncharacterized protein n=4 Tax=Mycobacteriaceae TaxID=1762 RepID=A0A5Q5BPB6_MYCSS|nr:hypothetical protein [Mycolicibacterium monacense DSM 44395]OBB58452.1 hypothetical protein A6B34_04530 [Mycolicibacterium monacense]ORB13370.1 hypothetical protein BST34_25095 [Mycolicibacterium monacense DSM 44395]QHP87912.1 hypothetical protein EWR22_22585 [Mycolicibacterium monacense DSM 44395]
MMSPDGANVRPMSHRLVRIYREGRAAYPHTIDCPYTGDLVAARMWRLGWQKARDEHRGIPPVTETLQRMSEQLADLAPLAERLGDHD